MRLIIIFKIKTSSMRIIFLSAAFAALAGCNDTKVKNSVSETDSEKNKPDVLAVNMDTTVSPSQDFFMYANGGWIKNNPIPADQGGWSIGNLVVEENLNRLRQISEKAATAGAAEGSTEQKIGDFWTSGMDSVKIEQQGLTPLKAYLDQINAITDMKSLISTTAALKKIGSSTLFSDYVTQDDKNSELMSYKLAQGGIGLPERQYYFKTDSTTANIRKEYVKYIVKVLTMSGEDSMKASTAAKNILALENRMAHASRKLE